MTLPEDIRPFDTGRNPHARKELWRSQDDLQEDRDMMEENWFPENTSLNIYQQPSFKKPRDLT
jgi:hypothetical protein